MRFAESDNSMRNRHCFLSRNEAISGYTRMWR